MHGENMVLPLVEPLPFLDGLDSRLPGLVTAREEASGVAGRVEEVKILNKTLELTQSADKKTWLTIK